MTSRTLWEAMHAYAGIGLDSEDRTSHMVLEVIRSHVANRGLGYPSDPMTRPLLSRRKFRAIDGAACPGRHVLACLPAPGSD